MIRIVQSADIPAIIEIYAPYITDNAISFELEVPSVAEIQQRIDKILPITPWLVYEIEGRVAGYAYASPHRDRLAYQWAREVSVYVHPDFRGRKIAHDLYTTLFAILKKQGYNYLLAGITQPNEPSVKFHESMGFTLLGIYHKIGYKLGAYHDVGWWELFIGDAHQPPQELIPFSQFKLEAFSISNYTPV